MSAVAVAAVATVVLLASRRSRPRPRRARAPVRARGNILALPLPAIVPAEPTRLDKIEALLVDLVADDAKPGGLYRVQWTDNVWDVADRALSVVGPHTKGDVLEYIHCMSAGDFNRTQFGTESTSRRYPNKYLVPGLGIGLRVAFMPRNQDGIDQMLAGNLPRMVVDPRTGKPASAHTSYGLIWLPPVDADALAAGEVTCGGHEWPDGSSAINPDPKLLNLLEAA